MAHYDQTQSASTLEEVKADPILHMLKAATDSATWKVVIETLRPVLHMLHKPLHRITWPHRRRNAP